MARVIQERDTEKNDKQPITNYVSSVYPILQQILYNIAVYRTIISCIQPSEDSLVENPDQRDCKVFRSERDNPFHCGRHEDFTVDEQVCAAMTRFRNKYIAHKTNIDVPVPTLDGAMKVMFDFDKKIRQEYDLEGYQNLEGWYETYTIQIEDLMEQYGIKE